MDQQVGHYKILEKIGSGGMGEVWLAEDTRLERNVALKFLPAEAVSEEEQIRFIREARAASALDHPNICTIHEVNESDKGQTYIAMAYCDGDTVKEKIARGPLTIEDALDIAIQTGEGLARAHKEGIIHRDIKPANVIVTKDGLAKIVDFGLAKLSGSTQLTRTGSSIGTVAYMSPEQVRGDEVDHRADIWSLGVMLYEMVTGQLPFQGDKETAVMYSALNEDPQSLVSIREDIPRGLEEVVGKALVKDLTNRYQGIQEMVEELSKISTDETGQQEWEKSIVVLPFEDMSPDKDNEYFSDGLTEEIITDLSKIHSLKVISRNSAMTLKGTGKTTKTIGRELNVQYVLEGSVRKAGNNLRITAQLIDATDDAHVWAEKYSGTLDDVFQIQEEVSRSIVDALKLKLSPEEERKIIERPTDDIQAYEVHLRAQYEMLRLTEEGLERALQLITDGLDAVGDNEILYADMGQVYLWYVDAAIKKEESYLDKAEEYAQKVFTLNPESSHGHLLRGWIHKRRGNIQEAVRELQEALTIDPNNLASLQHQAWILISMGKGMAVRPLVEKLVDIDPLTPMNHMMVGVNELMDGKFSSALEPLGKSHQLDRENPIFRFWYAKGFAYESRYDEAYTLLNSIEQDAPQTFWAQLSGFFRNALQGRKNEALQSVTEEFRSLMREDEIFPLWMAESYSLIDERDEAINWLESGTKYGFINYPFLNEYDPFLENIRGEEQFAKLMERVKHEWEHFEDWL